MQNKWVIPSWLKVGTNVVVTRGKKVPLGTKGVVVDVSSSGNGAYAYVRPDGAPDSDPIFWKKVRVVNLDPV
jgi:hypothetical protein